MKALVIAAAAAASLLALPSVSSAQAVENPWYDCGIGAMVFPDNNVAAAISNVIWDWGTTAVISNSSSPDTCEGAGAQAALMIRSSYAAIESETAVGEGRYLTALADVMDCSTEARAPLFAEVRTRMGLEMAKPEFTEMDKAAKAETYFNIVNDTVSTKYAGQCNLA